MHTETIQDQACSCSVHSVPSELNEQITDFYDLRNSCPALKLTIPDGIVQEHLKFTISKPDGAHHCSIPFLAYRRGCLVDFTKSLHRFALDGNKLQKEVTAQYKSDLRETWIFETDEISRFKKARSYLSRLAELDFARWLESQQWHVSNLEMYGGQFDVEGLQKGGIATTFEVKFLAQREVLFELNLASFTNPTTGWLGVYSPIDYLLFRLHEAARKLQEANTKRIAVAIVSDYDISYKIPLSEGWIDWASPKFLKRDSEIQQFLSAEYAMNQNLDTDLRTSISKLDEIWVLRYKDISRLHLEHRIIVP